MLRSHCRAIRYERQCEIATNLNRSWCLPCLRSITFRCDLSRFVTMQYDLIRSPRLVHDQYHDINRGANRDSGNAALEIIYSFVFFQYFRNKSYYSRHSETIKETMHLLLKVKLLKPVLVFLKTVQTLETGTETSLLPTKTP